MNKASVSVIITTCNRLDKLNKCVGLILENSTLPSEIIIIDQGDNRKTDIMIRAFHCPIIKYFKMGKKGLSAGRNLGIKKSKGDIIVFTDDDCLVDKNWLKNINLSFQENKNLYGIFGAVLPYKPQLNINRICPSIFLKTEEKIVDKPCYHSNNIGFGNNMAFRKEIFNKFGGFKKWLGIGSVGSSAEDAEFALRVLINKHKLLYNPNMIVYHNKWLTPKQMQKQQLSYTCGEMACYGYFAIQGHQFAKPIVWNNIKDSYYKIRRIIKKFLFFNWNKNLITDGKSAFIEILYRVRGLMVGWFYALIDPFRQ